MCVWGVPCLPGAGGGWGQVVKLFAVMENKTPALPTPSPLGFRAGDLAGGETAGRGGISCLRSGAHVLAAKRLLSSQFSRPVQGPILLFCRRTHLG